MTKSLAERMGATVTGTGNGAIREVQSNPALEGQRRSQVETTTASYRPQQTPPVQQGEPRQPVQNTQPRTVFDLIRAEREEFAHVLPAGHDVDQFIRDSLNYLQMNAHVRACSPFSILGALMSCAQLGLRPGVMGQSYLGRKYNRVKQEYEATFLIGYKGMVELAYRSPEVTSIIARVAYENDEFDVSYGLHEDIVHRPYMRGERGLPIAYYCIVRLRNGAPLFTVMSQAEMMEFREKYGSYDPSSPWSKDFEAMAMKTVLRQLSKWMPKSTAFGVAIAVDESVRNNLEGDIIHAAIPTYATPEGDNAEEGGLLAPSPEQHTSTTPQGASPQEAQQAIKEPSARANRIAESYREETSRASAPKQEVQTPDRGEEPGNGTNTGQENAEQPTAEHNPAEVPVDYNMIQEPGYPSDGYQDMYYGGEEYYN